MERGLEGGRERRRETEGPGLSVPDPCQHGRRGGRFRSRDAGGVTECRREGDESRGRERGKVMGERGSGGGVGKEISGDSQFRVPLLRLFHIHQ